MKANRRHPIAAWQQVVNHLLIVTSFLTWAIPSFGLHPQEPTESGLEETLTRSLTAPPVPGSTERSGLEGIERFAVPDTLGRLLEEQFPTEQEFQSKLGLELNGARYLHRLLNRTSLAHQNGLLALQEGKLGRATGLLSQAQADWLEAHGRVEVSDRYGPFLRINLLKALEETQQRALDALQWIDTFTGGASPTPAAGLENLKWLQVTWVADEIIRRLDERPSPDQTASIFQKAFHDLENSYPDLPAGDRLTLQDFLYFLFVSENVLLDESFGGRLMMEDELRPRYRLDILPQLVAFLKRRVEGIDRERIDRDRIVLDAGTALKTSLPPDEIRALTARVLERTLPAAGLEEWRNADPVTLRKAPRKDSRLILVDFNGLGDRLFVRFDKTVGNEAILGFLAVNRQGQPVPERVVAVKGDQLRNLRNPSVQDLRLIRSVRLLAITDHQSESVLPFKTNERVVLFDASSEDSTQWHPFAELHIIVRPNGYSNRALIYPSAPEEVGIYRESKFASRSGLEERSLIVPLEQVPVQMQQVGLILAPGVVLGIQEPFQPGLQQTLGFAPADRAVAIVPTEEEALGLRQSGVKFLFWLPRHGRIPWMGQWWMLRRYLLGQGWRLNWSTRRRTRSPEGFFRNLLGRLFCFRIG